MVIGMLLVGKCRIGVAILENALQGEGPLECVCQLARFLGEVVAIEAIKPGVSIPLLLEEGLPPLPSGGETIRGQRLRHDNAWAVPAPVPTEQNIPLGALDVHFQKID